MSTDFFKMTKKERDKETKAGKMMKSEDIAERVLFRPAPTRTVPRVDVAGSSVYGYRLVIFRGGNAPC
ncbi:MAG: hypothetical protein ACR2HJ_09200 [Fimbriimonadales bacterium]